MSREEKMVFQTKVIPFTLIRGIFSGWDRIIRSDVVSKRHNGNGL